MTDINSVFIIGRLTKDVEITYTQNGYALGKASLAVNHTQKKNGEYVEETSFFQVNIYGKMAESLRPYLLKGKRIGIDGNLRQNRWEKDGQKFSRVEINANAIQLLSSTENNQNQSAQNNNYGYYGA